MTSAIVEDTKSKLEPEPQPEPKPKGTNTKDVTSFKFTIPPRLSIFRLNDPSNQKRTIITDSEDKPNDLTDSSAFHSDFSGAIIRNGIGSQAARHNGANTYFANFPSFDENPRAPILQEFNRLADSQGWPRKTGRLDDKPTRYRSEKIACLYDQFDMHFDPDHTYENAKRLCAEVGISPIPDTYTRCTEV